MNVYVHLVTGIVSVQFAVLLGFLVFLFFRTRSKGLIWIATALTLMKLQMINYSDLAVWSCGRDAGKSQGGDMSDRFGSQVSVGFGSYYPCQGMHEHVYSGDPQLFPCGHATLHPKWSMGICGHEDYSCQSRNHGGRQCPRNDLGERCIKDTETTKDLLQLNIP